MASQIKAVGFDMGNVFIHDMPHENIVPRALRQLFPSIPVAIDAEIGQKAEHEWQEFKHGRVPSSAVWEAIFKFISEKCPELGIQFNEELMHRFEAECFSLLRENFYGVHEKVIEIAKELKAAGYTVAVLSNHVKDWFEDALKQMNFVERSTVPEQLILVSYQINAAKPSHDSYRILLERINQYRVSNGQEPISFSELAFVDDKQRNTVAAEQLGIRAIVHASSKEDSSALRSKLAEIGVKL